MSEKKQQVLKSLKLNKLSENHLEKREMKVLKGGCGCQNHDAYNPKTMILIYQQVMEEIRS